MGLLSKLFGKEGKEAENAVSSLFKDILGNSNSTTTSSSGDSNTYYQNTAPAPAPSYSGDSPSGFSWGEEMPNEPNQYNYNGTYVQYFEEIFRTEFPEYRLDKEFPNSKRVIFTFWKGAEKALVVELMHDSSSSVKLRENCRRQGIPYLRYYYDHDGWWNTREYVITRTRNAIR